MKIDKAGVKVPQKSEVYLCEDEVEFLKKSERCPACGHLEALHNYHCCEFCTVPGCKCEWGNVPRTLSVLVEGS